ncbi:MAG: hypothetical protein M4579_004701 [Chaenotheca gracillima]|nr:MAG: hypothetical protein M4579_004701 [Chaenotheca gracillima]
MAELQQQSGGGQGSERAEQDEKTNPAAASRLGTVQIVKPLLVENTEDQLIAAVQMQRLKPPVSEEDTKMMLRIVSDHQRGTGKGGDAGGGGKIVIHRKKTSEESGSDEDENAEDGRSNHSDSS